MLWGSNRGRWAESIDFFLSPACGVEPGAFVFFSLLDFRFTFLFSHSPHDLDTFTFLISLLFFLSHPHNLLFDSRASFNPRKFRFCFRCCFWLLLLHFKFHLGSQFKPCTYIHEFLVLRNSHHHHHHRNITSILDLNSSTTRHSVLLPYHLLYLVFFFFFKSSLESIHLYVWFVNLFRGLTNV